MEMLNWEELESTCRNCSKCVLHKTKKNTVFGVGNKNASLVFVGEAPGAKEDEMGIPFVGSAGQLLDKYLCAVGIDREDVYIANILKCRPPANRDPLPEEQDACIEHLWNQLSLLQPKLIVCLGRISAMRLIKPDFHITSEHGKMFKKGNKVIAAVYHPAALLRDPHKKEDMLTDMKAIKQYLDSCE